MHCAHLTASLSPSSALCSPEELSEPRLGCCEVRPMMSSSAGLRLALDINGNVLRMERNLKDMGIHFFDF